MFILFRAMHFDPTMFGFYGVILSGAFFFTLFKFSCVSIVQNNFLMPLSSDLSVLIVSKAIVFDNAIFGFFGVDFVDGNVFGGTVFGFGGASFVQGKLFDATIFGFFGVNFVQDSFCPCYYLQFSGC